MSLERLLVRHRNEIRVALDRELTPSEVLAIDQQLADDVCLAHREFCCPLCYEVGTDPTDISTIVNVSGRVVLYSPAAGWRAGAFIGELEGDDAS